MGRLLRTSFAFVALGALGLATTLVVGVCGALYAPMTPTRTDFTSRDASCYALRVRRSWVADHVMFAVAPRWHMRARVDAYNADRPREWDFYYRDENGIWFFSSLPVTVWHDEELPTLLMPDAESDYRQAAADMPAWVSLPDAIDLRDPLYSNQTAAGWPFRAFNCAYETSMMLDLYREPWTQTGILNIAFSDVRPAAGVAPLGSARSERVFPLKPLWGGLLANTAAFGGAWYLLLATPIWLRRAIRYKRGCCTRCGYDLRDTDDGPCPECGRSTPRGSRSVSSSGTRGRRPA